MQWSVVWEKVFRVITARERLCFFFRHEALGLGGRGVHSVLTTNRGGLLLFRVYTFVCMLSLGRSALSTYLP